MTTPISIVGTIATVPRLLTPEGGSPFCSFRVASNDRRYDRESGTWVDTDTNWFSVAAFRSLGEHAYRSFDKGDRVLVQGRLRIRNWETTEKSGTSVEIDAEALGHDVRWGTSRFTKTPSPGSSSTERVAADGETAAGSDTGAEAIGAEPGSVDPVAAGEPAGSAVDDPGRWSFAAPETATASTR